MRHEVDILFCTKAEELMLRKIPEFYSSALHDPSAMSGRHVRMEFYLIDCRSYSGCNQDAFRFEDIEVRKSFAVKSTDHTQQSHITSSESTNELRFAFVNQVFHRSPSRRIRSGELVINLRLRALISQRPLRMSRQLAFPFGWRSVL